MPSTSLRALVGGLAAATAALALPGAALATSVARPQGENGPEVQILDTAGVTDKLTVTGNVNDGVTVTSTNGLALTAGINCTAQSSTVVSCLGGAGLLTAGLGDGNDVLVDRSNLQGNLNGNAGTDFLTAGLGTSKLFGGPGDDFLSVGEGLAADGIARTEELHGDAGDDLLDLSGDRSNPDTASGGDGTDTVRYDRRTDPVHASIDGVANDGALTFRLGLTSSEGDNVGTDVENLNGGGGGDTLTGSAGPNRLQGFFGGDTLNGNGGNDVLAGGNGDDVENGGPGDDLLGSVLDVQNSPDVGADTFRGGDGIDTITSADAITDKVIDCGAPSPVEFGGDLAVIDLVDPVPTGCEGVQRAAKDQHPTVQVRGGAVKVRNGRVALRLTCPKAAPGGHCNGTLEIRKGKRRIARHAYRIAGGHTRAVRLAVGSVRGSAEAVTHEKDTKGRPEETQTRINL